MKISALHFQHLSPTIFLQHSTNEKISEKRYDSTNIILSAAGLCAVGFCGAIMYKSFSKAENNLLQNNLSEIDKSFYKKIIKSLKKEGIEVNIEALKSIAAPDEFSALIRKFKPEHYRVGLQVSEAKAKNVPLEEFYKNAVNGDFRVSLHTHSNCSDGKSSPEEFLECARKYADKVAKLNKNDDLPPFTIALTDHDCIDGCREIIKLIAKNPEKYKNVKFVSGCEFSVKNGDKHHDITGLALNPFDSSLSKDLTDLYVARKQTVQNFLDKQPEFNGKRITQADLIEFEKEYYKKKGKDGKHSIENGSGVVSVRHALKFFYKMTNQNPDKGKINYLGEKDILPIEKVVNIINNNGGYASLTHPLKSFWSYIGDDALLKLKNMGVKGIEVNHQYTPSKITKIGEVNNNINDADNIYNRLTEQYRIFAEHNDMFMSGGTDSHEKQIFSREPHITQEFLNSKIL